MVPEILIGLVTALTLGWVALAALLIAVRSQGDSLPDLAVALYFAVARHAIAPFRNTAKLAFRRNWRG